MGRPGQANAQEGGQGSAGGVKGKAMTEEEGEGGREQEGALALKKAKHPWKPKGMTLYERTVDYGSAGRVESVRGDRETGFFGCRTNVGVGVQEKHVQETKIEHLLEPESCFSKQRMASRSGVPKLVSTGRLAFPPNSGLVFGGGAVGSSGVERNNVLPLSAAREVDNVDVIGSLGGKDGSLNVWLDNTGNISAFDPSRRGLTSSSISRQGLMTLDDDEETADVVGKKRASSPQRCTYRTSVATSNPNLGSNNKPSIPKSTSTEHLYMNKTTSHTYCVAAAGSHRWVILGK